MRLVTKEKGPIEVLIVYSTAGTWEDDWEPLRGTPWGDLVTVVSKEAMDHALHGWSWPLAKALGLPPRSALRKVPVAGRECAQKETCPLFLPKNCHPSSDTLPWCFEPAGAGPLAPFASKLVQTWREGVYVVVVED